MVTTRRFWYNLTGGVVAMAGQFFIMGIFFVGYMPTFGKQPIDQQITIVVSLATAAVFFAGEIAGSAARATPNGCRPSNAATRTQHAARRNPVIASAPLRPVPRSGSSARSRI